MKIAVLSFSGNVGKSTIAAHLLKPRMTEAQLVAVEVANAQPSETATIDPGDFDTLMSTTLQYDNLVMDIGASSVGSFVKLMRKYAGSIEEFDLFLIPTTLGAKAIRDTLATVNALKDLNVPPDRVICVINRVNTDEPNAQHFKAIQDLAATEKTFRVLDDVIHENEVFARAERAKRSIDEIAHDESDLRSAFKAATSDDERDEIIDQIATKRLAVGVIAELDRVFKGIARQRRPATTAKTAKA